MPSSSALPTTAKAPLRLWQRLLAGVLALLVLLVAGFFLGPRYDAGASTPAQREPPPQDIAALDDWLAAGEARQADIKPGNAKGIIWNGAAKQRTPWSIVYLHGFSASRGETAPLTDEVARALGANVFYTRLSGHGRSSAAAMGEASLQDWMADTLEAVRIGQTLGERVLLISCSTGSTLASWLATTPEGVRVAADVFISPNYGPKDKRAEIINGPWGMEIAQALQGEYTGASASNAREAQITTPRYPTRALHPMMAIVERARAADLSKFQTPVLVLYSENDQTVDPQETLTAFKRIGAPLKAIESVGYSKSKGQHVLAGETRDPQAVAPMAASIVKWVQALPR